MKSRFFKSDIRPPEILKNSRLRRQKVEISFSYTKVVQLFAARPEAAAAGCLARAGARREGAGWTEGHVKVRLQAGQGRPGPGGAVAQGTHL